MSDSVSIITPSFNGLSYLKRCCASVADQQGTNVEHIIMDGGSTDGTVNWLKQQKRLRWTSEQDKGMYDAVNKGLRQASGDIVAYLNCDEQYLPATLMFVLDFFKNHPTTDILFGSMLLIHPDGSLIAYRKAYQPYWPLIMTSHLYVYSCAMFMRRSIIDAGFFFNPELKDIGDADLVVRILRAGLKASITQRYLAAFTWTGNNMSVGQNAKKEISQMLQNAPPWIRTLKAPLNLARLAIKGLTGCYTEKSPLQYALYTAEHHESRVMFSKEKPSCRWITAQQTS